MEKYGISRQATDGNVTRLMRTASWITKATHTHTHTHIQNIFLFHGNNVYANSPQYYVYTYTACLVALGTFRLLHARGSYGDVRSDSSPLGRYAVIINSYGVTPQRLESSHCNYKVRGKLTSDLVE